MNPSTRPPGKGNSSTDGSLPPEVSATTKKRASTPRVRRAAEPSRPASDPAKTEPVATAVSLEKRTVPVARDLGPESKTPQERHRLIARAAYLRSENRGFAPGYELEDWLSAERELDADTSASRTKPD